MPRATSSQVSAVCHRLSTFGRSLRLGLLVGLVAAPGLAAQQPTTLARAIEMAQQQGFQAKAASATRDAARFRNRAFWSRRLPQLSLGGTVPAYNRSIVQVVQPDGSTLFLPLNQTNASLTATLSQQIPLTGGSIFLSSALSRLTVSGQQDVDRWSSTPFSVGIRQDVFRPNAALWDRREEMVRSELTERQYLEAREDIAIDTATLFFNASAAKMALQNAVKNVGVNDTLYTLNKGRFEVGRIGENDLLQSELALLRARTSLDVARLDYDRTFAALRLGLNAPAGVQLEIAVTAEVPPFDADTTRAVAEALRNRASVSDVELQGIQAKRRITEAQLASGIGATVTASFGYNATAERARLAYQDLQDARQFAVSVQFPLWQWGARAETVEAARSEQERTVSLGQSTLEQTAQDAHFAALQLSQARRNLMLSAKADTVAGKRFEVAYNRYVIGRIAIDNLYVAQNEKDQALVQFVQSLRGYWQAYYRLRRLTLFDFEAGLPIR